MSERISPLGSYHRSLAGGVIAKGAFGKIALTFEKFISSISGVMPKAFEPQPCKATKQLSDESLDPEVQHDIPPNLSCFISTYDLSSSGTLSPSLGYLRD